MRQRAILFDVQRFCLHDGPGIRTVVFFKGCAMACRWCQNPEGRTARPELFVSREESACGSCGLCLPRCPKGALSLEESLGRTSGTTIQIDESRCDDCLICVDVCPRDVLRAVGRETGASELTEEVLRDREFFEESGGGVTLSGGEAVLHSEFLREWLPALKAQGIHVLLETAGHYPWSRLESLLPWLDTVYFDLKLGSEKSARHHLGVPLGVSMGNLRTLLSLKDRPSVEVRVPCVPGVTDRPEERARLGELLVSLGVGRVSLLPYNRFWEPKAKGLKSSRRPEGLHLGFHRSAEAENEVRRDWERIGIEVRSAGG